MASRTTSLAGLPTGGPEGRGRLHPIAPLRNPSMKRSSPREMPLERVAQAPSPSRGNQILGVVTRAVGWISPVTARPVTQRPPPPSRQQAVEIDPPPKRAAGCAGTADTPADSSPSPPPTATISGALSANSHSKHEGPPAAACTTIRTGRHQQAARQARGATLLRAPTFTGSAGRRAPGGHRDRQSPETVGVIRRAPGATGGSDWDRSLSWLVNHGGAAGLREPGDSAGPQRRRWWPPSREAVGSSAAARIGFELQGPAAAPTALQLGAA